VSEGHIKSIDDLTLAYVPALTTTEYGKTSIRDPCPQWPRHSERSVSGWLVLSQ